MDAFSYLSVLLSVVLGLAVQQILQGYRALVLARGRVRPFWPAMAWSLFLLMLIAQHWWASFSLSGNRDWTFAAFAMVLVTAALIYMMSALVLPDAERDQPVDMEAHYWREVPIFFGLATAAVAASVAREWLLEGRLPSPGNLGFHLLFAAISLVAIAVRRAWLHKLFAVVMGGVFVSYIATLFTRLA